MAIIILTTTIYLWLRHDISPQEERYKNDVDPGKYKAKLTLSDGLAVVLDNTTSGVLAKQDKTTIVNKDGQLV